MFARSDGLSGDYIEGLFEDREGNIWVATMMASTAFATSPSPRFLSSKVCPVPALRPFWRPGMEAFGLARLMA